MEPLSQTSPYGDTLAQINSKFNAIADQDRTKIIKNTGVPQVLFGYQQGGFGDLDYGLKVSKTSGGVPYDVTTATEDQLQYSSAFNYVRQVAKGSINLNVGVGDLVGGSYYLKTGSVAHGLGYEPMVAAFLNANPAAASLRQPLPFIDYSPGAFFLEITVYAYITVDGTNVSFTVVLPGPSFGLYGGDWSCTYQLLRETVA